MINQNLIPSQIATVYVNYLKAFLKRADVMNGKLVSYHDNQDPNDNLKFENWLNLGDVLTTTGFCVSVCQGIMYDEVFHILLNSRKAMAKLISIDIKEQFYGYCKPSYVQNMWHTAILVRDNDINLILDPTCAQFGNQFVGKFVWDFETWLNTFRSANDTHEIKAFNDNIIDFAPTSIRTENYTQALISITNCLHRVTTLTDNEREILADFFLNGCDLLNRKIIMGNMTDNDFKYMASITNLLQQLPMKFDNGDYPRYSILKFENKNAAKTWITRFQKDKFILPLYMALSDSVENSCYWFGFKPEEINKETVSEISYIVFEFNTVSGFDVNGIIKHLDMFVPYGIQLNVEDIFNGGKILSDNVYDLEKKTNTIYVKVSC